MMICWMASYDDIVSYISIYDCTWPDLSTAPVIIWHWQVTTKPGRSLFFLLIYTSRITYFFQSEAYNLEFLCHHLIYILFYLYQMMMRISTVWCYRHSDKSTCLNPYIKTDLSYLNCNRVNFVFKGLFVI